RSQRSTALRYSGQKPEQLLRNTLIYQPGRPGFQQGEELNGLAGATQTSGHFAGHYSAARITNQIVRSMWLNFPDFVQIRLRHVFNGLVWQVLSVQAAGLE